MRLHYLIRTNRMRTRVMRIAEHALQFCRMECARRESTWFIAEIRRISNELWLFADYLWSSPSPLPKFYLSRFILHSFTSIHKTKYLYFFNINLNVIGWLLCKKSLSCLIEFYYKLETFWKIRTCYPSNL